MGLALVLSGVGLLLLPAATRPLGRQLPPDQWARLCTAALVVGAALLELSALLYAAPTVFRAAGIPSLAVLCEQMFGPLVPGGAAAGWAAMTIALTMPFLAAVGIRRACRTQRAVRAEPGTGEHRDWNGYDLVVLPTAQPIALGVPGHPHQIVVSAGLLAALGPNATEAVLRHEAAHLHHRHHRYLITAAAIDHAVVFLPPVRRSTKVLRASLERWADEVAAGGAPGRRQALRGALLDVTRAMVAPMAVAAFSTAETILERVDALDRPAMQPPRRTRLALYAPGVALGALATIALSAWAANTQLLIAMAGTCPPV